VGVLGLVWYILGGRDGRALSLHHGIWRLYTLPLQGLAAWSSK
jgi:hypothetical protein